ncbi:hypothetical protein H5410_042658 [Solanum commersonii]|uniref:Putative plant transposon protein domain-containing protein n=1 Tax=Solanum commersonii TaxID=4109 RepID=A0A9J5XY46_SOLCO|nr:hypothetical protein H5410_042658 [Solanum commersonii]
MDAPSKSCEITRHVRVANLVNMSSTQRSSKTVASIAAVTSEGKKWYKSHTKAKYFLDADPSECNVSVVREFYANWMPDARSHFVTVRGMEVPLTPAALNQLLGTTDAPLDVLTGINISPPYHHIRHAMCGFTEVTRDRVCLVYALMKDLPINVEAVLKLAMRNTRVHRGRRYAFGGLITNLYRRAGVPEKSLVRRDEMIMARMFGLEMLRHRNGCRASTQEQLNEIATKYPLNEQTEALLGLGRAFIKPVWDDVPTNEDKRQTMSDSESDSEAEEDDLLALEGTNGDVDMDE